VYTEVSLFVRYCECRISLHYFSLSLFFFFQAEDGIRDRNVTGVQTCALPISPLISPRPSTTISESRAVVDTRPVLTCGGKMVMRSEERRVGKECRSRWSP